MKRSKTQLLRSLVAVMLLGAGLASCSQDDFADNRQGEPLPPGEYPLILTAGGLEVVATPAQKSAPSTRGTVEDDWLNTGYIAVQVGDGTPNKYEATGLKNDKKTAILKGIDENNTHYWESATEKKTITAWHPHSNVYPDNWLVEADQRAADSYQASDLIKGELKDLAFDARDTEMTFKHQTAKIIVNLTEPVGGVVFDENTTVELLNVEGVKGGGNTIKTYRPNNTGNTYYALLNPQQLQKNTPLIQVNTGGNTYIWTPDKDKDLLSGTVYTYTITVSNTGLTVKVDDGIAWDDDGAAGSGSVDLTTFVLDNNDDRTFELTEGDEITVKGNGSQSKGKLTFKIPSGSTATVNLEEINIINSATGQQWNELFNIIQIEGGGKVIFNLIGTNTIELNANSPSWSSVAICAYDSDIEITGGKLEIKGNGDAVIVAHGGGNITINETAIYMNYMGNHASRLPCIGSGAYTTCGEIVIYKSDVEINYKSATMYLSGIAPAIGPCKNEGKCGDVTITLKDGQTKSNFLDKITLTDKEGTTFSDVQKVIYGPGITTDQYGTLTWLDSAGKPITE